MQVNVQVLEGLNRKVTVTVPADGIEQEIEGRIKEFAPRVKVPGFREGRVPVSLVRQQYGDSIRNEVLTDVLRKTYREALEKEKLVPASTPSMHFINTTAGQPLEYEATFEVYPSVELKGIDQISIERQRVEITEQDVDEMLERLKKQFVAWIKVDRSAKLGDQLLIDFDGKINGEAFEGSAGKSALLELGSGSAIPGFEEGLVGASAGEEITLNLQFPDNYFRKELAGKPVVLIIKVYQVAEVKLPEFGEEFAQKFGIKEGGMSGLREQVYKNMERDVEQMIRIHARDQLVNQLLAINSFEVPNSLVRLEAEKLKKQAEQQAAQMKQQLKEPLLPQQFIHVAKQRVALGLLLGGYVRIHGLKPDPARVQEMLSRIAAMYKDSSSVIAWYHNHKEQMVGLENIVLEEQVLEELMKQIEIKETSMSYADFARRSEGKAQPVTV